MELHFLGGFPTLLGRRTSFFLLSNHASDGIKILTSFEYAHRNDTKNGFLESCNQPRDVINGVAFEILDEGRKAPPG